MSTPAVPEPPRAPAPWEVPERLWLALPAVHPVPGLLAEARDAVAGLAETLGAHAPVAVLTDPDDADAARLLPGVVERVPVRGASPLPGREGPTFVHAAGTRGSVEAVHWRLPSDAAGTAGRAAATADAVARSAGLPLRTPLFSAPAGTWAADGDGTAVVSAALLDPAVNEGWTRAQAEDALAGLLGAERVLWLPPVAGHAAGPWDGGGAAQPHPHPWLRFVAPGEVAVHWQPGRLHPDHAASAAALHALTGARDARGRALSVRTVRALPPGPDADLEARGPLSALDLLPLAPGVVLRPAHADPEADAATAEAAAALFPGAEQVPFPGPPLLRLLGTLSDLVLPQPPGGRTRRPSPAPAHPEGPRAAP